MIPPIPQLPPSKPPERVPDFCARHAYRVFYVQPYQLLEALQRMSLVPHDVDLRHITFEGWTGNVKIEEGLVSKLKQPINL